VLRLLFICLVVLFAAACSRAQPRRAEPPPVVAAKPPPEWAKEVAVAAEAASPHRPPTAAKAPIADEAYAQAGEVLAHRIVYRVALVVPESLKERRAALASSAGELHVDVTHDRLRARFVGASWPLDDGSEVRLRMDVPGVYVFDGLGGRPLAPGELAAWFEARTGKWPRSGVRIRRETGREDEEPSEPICAFLAEWTNQERAQLAPRCAGGSIPPSFRFGPWRAELTAMMPLEVERAQLRADEQEPPAPIEHASRGFMLEPGDIERLVPTRGSAGTERGSLVIDNPGDTRLVVFLQGVALGWVDPGHALRVEGMQQGSYRAGAIRPFGVLRLGPKEVAVPGTLTARPRR
jgi:hypothetical protein